MRLPHRHPLAWLAATVIAVLVVAAVSASATVDALDTAAVQGVHLTVVEPPVTAWILGLTDLGGTDIVLLVTVVACLALGCFRHWHGALLLLLSVLATQAAVHAAKSLFSRPRPESEYAVGEPSGFSFPSGHSATAVALYLTLAVIVAGALRGPARAVVAVAGVLLVLLVGASRVYLGAHYPSDVLAGWLTGAAVVLACWALVRWLRRVGPWAQPAPA